MDMSAVEGETSADTIYAIDRVADDTLIGWFEQHWPDVEVVSEGLEEPVVVGGPPDLDGDRRHHRRHARADVRQAPGVVPRRRRPPRWLPGATSSPSAMTELPTVKQGAADQLSGVRGGGVVAERVDLRTGDRERADASARRRPPTSSTASAASPSSSCRASPTLAELEAELFRRLGCRDVFDDEYISSGGQLHELLTGRRPLRRRPPPARRSRRAGACHPYDVCTAMLLEEAGGVVTDPLGRPARRAARHDVAGRLGRLRQPSPGRDASVPSSRSSSMSIVAR